MALIHLALAVPRISEHKDRNQEDPEDMTAPALPHAERSVSVFHYAVTLCYEAATREFGLCLVNFHNAFTKESQEDALSAADLSTASSCFVASYSVPTEDAARITEAVRYLEQRLRIDAERIGVQLVACLAPRLAEPNAPWSAVPANSPGITVMQNGISGEWVWGRPLQGRNSYQQTG